MDFLVLFGLYVVVFGLFVLFYLYENHPILSTGVIGRLRENVVQIIWYVVPSSVIDQVQEFINYVFNKRNHVMQIVFLLLVLSGHLIWMADILTILYMVEPAFNHTTLTFFLWFGNFYCFFKVCCTDPGKVTHRNAEGSYDFDGIFYVEGSECCTCKLTKPARSKHCHVCDMCVHRFDHHCVWTNSCIGAGNVFYFNTFLVSLIAICINGIYTCVYALYIMCVFRDVFEMAYVNEVTGETKPITIPVLIQHLFMEYPRVVFLAFSLSVLAVLLGAFAVYHLFLLLTNQSTNERYKLHRILRMDSTANQKTPTYYRPYSRGMFYNLKQALYPSSFHKTKSKKK